MPKKKSRIKTFYRTIRAPFERLGVRLAAFVVPRLSLAGLLRLSRLLADIGFFFDRKGRRVAAANLRVICGRELSARRVRVLTRGCYRNMMRILLTIFWMTRDPRERNRRIAFLEDRAAQLLSENRPAITLSAHFGNWEVLSQTCETHGFHMTSVAKNVKGAGFTEQLTQARAAIGQDILPQEGALRGLLHALKHGSCVGLLVDQHTEIRDGGIWLDFFGLKACFSQGPAMLARMAKVPMIIGWSFPLKDGRYRVVSGRVFPFDAGARDVAKRTEEIIREFEHVIRRHPHLWSLNYMRWRYLIPGEDHARYPFYAKPARPAQYCQRTNETASANRANT